jgi:protein-disulfide isomerase
MKRHLPLLIIVLTLIVAVGAGTVFLRSKRTNSTFIDQPAGTTTPGTVNATPQPTPANSSASATPAAASPARTASVTLEEFGDYQCPPCGSLHPELKKIKAEYGDRLVFVFRNLPLPTIHKNALTAAQAAEAARLQDRFWEMHDKLYETQNAWTDLPDPHATFVGYARQLRLDVKRFRSDMAGAEVQKHLAEDQQRTEALKLESTPTILLDGRQLRPQVSNPDGIRRAIDFLLSQKPRG